jgi:hypothetical protein
MDQFGLNHEAIHRNLLISILLGLHHPCEHLEWTVRNLSMPDALSELELTDQNAPLLSGDQHGLCTAAPAVSDERA